MKNSEFQPLPELDLDAERGLLLSKSENFSTMIPAFLGLEQPLTTHTQHTPEREKKGSFKRFKRWMKSWKRRCGAAVKCHLAEVIRKNSTTTSSSSAVDSGVDVSSLSPQEDQTSDPLVLLPTVMAFAEAAARAPPSASDPLTTDLFPFAVFPLIVDHLWQSPSLSNPFAWYPLAEAPSREKRNLNPFAKFHVVWDVPTTPKKPQAFDDKDHRHRQQHQHESKTSGSFVIPRNDSNETLCARMSATLMPKQVDQQASALPLPASHCVYTGPCVPSAFVGLGYWNHQAPLSAVINSSDFETIDLNDESSQDDDLRRELFSKSECPSDLVQGSQPLLGSSERPMVATTATNSFRVENELVYHEVPSYVGYTVLEFDTSSTTGIFVSLPSRQGPMAYLRRKINTTRSVVPSWLRRLSGRSQAQE